MVRMILKWSVLLLGSLAILGLLVVGVLSLTPGERYLLELVQRKGIEVLGQQVQIGSLEINVFSRIRMKNVRIYQEKAGTTTPFLDLGQATIEYNLFDVLRRKIVIRSISIRDVVITVVSDSAGNLNIPLPKKKETTTKKAHPGIVSFDMRKISLSNANLHYKNRTIPLDTELMGASGELLVLGPSGYRVSIAADSARFTYKAGTLTADHITMNGNWSGNHIIVDRAAATLSGMALSCSSLEYGAGSDSLLGGHAILSGEAGDVIDFIRDAFAPKLPPMQGTVVLNVELGGSPGSPRVSVVLAAPVFRVGELQLENTHLKGLWANAVAVVDSFRTDALGGNAHGHGKLNTHTLLAEDVAVTMRGLDARGIGRLVGAPLYGGTIDGRIEGGGYINDPQRLRATAQVMVRRPEYRSRTFPDITGTGTIADGTADIAIAGGGATIAVSSKIDGERLNGTFTADIPHLSDFALLAGRADVTGKLAARGILGGTISSPVVQASLIGDSITYGNFPVDNLDGGILWRNKKVSFSHVRVSGDVASFEALRPPFHVDSLFGGMHYTVFIDGALDALEGEVTAQVDHPSYRGIHFDTGLLRATVHGDTISIEQASLERDSLSITASGVIDYRRMVGSADMNISGGPGGNGALSSGSVSTQFDIKDMQAVAVRVQGSDVALPLIRQFFPSLPEMGGIVSFTGTIDGGVKNPEAGFVFQIAKPAFRTASLDSLRGTVSFREGRILIQPLELFREEYYSIFEGSLALEKTETFFRISPPSAVKGMLRGEKFHLDYVKGLVPGIKQLSGVASYDISFDGPLSAPHPEGRVTVDGFSMSAKGDTLTLQGIDLVATLHDDAILLNARNGMIFKQPYSLDARITYAHPVVGGTIDLFLSGVKALNVNGTVTKDRLEVKAHADSFDLSLLSDLFPAMGEVSGIASSDLVITGTAKNPHPEGTLNITNLNLNVPGVDLPLRNGIVNLSITADRIVVDTLLVQSNKGSIRVWGAIENILSGSPNGKLRAVIEKVRVRKKDSFDILVKSADLDLAKTGTAYRLGGKVALGESRLLYDFTMPSLLKKVTARGGPKTDGPEFLKQVGLELSIDSGKDFSFENSLASIPLRADLKLTGTLAAPIVVGEVTATEGEVQYLDRTFNITEGMIEFRDRTKLNPILNIQAETTVKAYQTFGADSYRVTLLVTGTMEKPSIKLISDPALDTPNIISLLTLGVTRQQVGIGAAASDTTSSLQGALQQRAELLASQRIGGYLGSRVGNILGLGDVVIEGNLFDFSGEDGGPRIIASKQLSNKVEVTSITTLGHMSDQGIRINYTLTERIALRGETDIQGRSGFDVLYRLRFK